MKSLLLGLHKDLHTLRQKLEHQCTAISRQVIAVERLTNPGMMLLGGSLKSIPPPYGTRLKAAEDAVITYLDHKHTEDKTSSADDQPLMPSDPKLPLLINMTLQTCSQYLSQKAARIIDWRTSTLIPIMEDTLGPITDSNINEQAWVQVSDSEMTALRSDIAMLQSFEHPLARSGTEDEGFLARFMRDMALEQGGYKSFRSRLLLNKDEWRDLIKCLNAEVAELVLSLYGMVEETLQSALLLDLPLQEKMRLVRMASDAISLSLYLTRDIK